MLNLTYLCGENTPQGTRVFSPHLFTIRGKDMNNLDIELIEFRAQQNPTADNLMLLAGAKLFSGQEQAAFTIASKAAYEYRSGEAYSFIGECLIQGRGVIRDLEKGIKALQRAISLGDEIAPMILQRLHKVAA